MVFAYVPFPYYLFQCTSQTSVDDEQSKEDDDHKDLKCNFILFASFCVVVIPLYYRDMRHFFFLPSSQKKSDIKLAIG
jgi:hypothetical protein